MAAVDSGPGASIEGIAVNMIYQTPTGDLQLEGLTISMIYNADRVDTDVRTEGMAALIIYQV